MASSNTGVDKNEERKKQVMLGELPHDFLEITPSAQQQQVVADHHTAYMLQQHQQMTRFYPLNAVGKLNVTVTQAKLVKNYGVTRMDPYCRIRIGHSVYETHTDHNGAKNPRWSKIIQCYLPEGVDNFYLEIFDECAFTVDERIAWGHYKIPENIYKGDTIDEWFPLSGRHGTDKEGTINLVLSYTPLANIQPVPTVMYPGPVAPTMIMSGYPTPVYGVPIAAPPPSFPYYTQQPTAAYRTATPPRQQPQPQPITEEDLKLVQEMFPAMEAQVVKSVMEANNGNKDASINMLLQMNSDN